MYGTPQQVVTGMINNELVKVYQSHTMTPRLSVPVISFVPIAGLKTAASSGLTTSFQPSIM
jgi:hypothetical protein